MITQARLKELFDYDADAGNLIWKIATSSRVKVGDIAGAIGGRGYCEVKIDGCIYKAHRLVWLYHHGKFPDHEIDHIDRDRTNNRIENLRDVPSVVNQLNKNQPSNTGYAGVSRRANRFQAKIYIFGETAYLGLFDTPEEAHAVYKRVHFDLHREHSQYAAEFA